MDTPSKAPPRRVSRRRVRAVEAAAADGPAVSTADAGMDSATAVGSDATDGSVGEREPGADADTIADASASLDLAHPLRRLYAAFIDFGLWLAVVYWVAPIAGGGQGVFHPTAALIDVFAFFGYFVFLTGLFGRTAGKWVAGIKVVDAEGRTPGVAVAIPREMAGRFVAAIVAGVGLAWIVFDPRRQGWHDKIAGTYVINAGEAGPTFLSRFLTTGEQADDDSKRRAGKSDAAVGSRSTVRRRRRHRRRGGGSS